MPSSRPSRARARPNRSWWESRPTEARATRLREYRWSTYRSYAGLEKAWPFVAYRPLLAMAGSEGRGRNSRYREFVESGLAESDEEFRELAHASATCIGGEGFRAWVAGLYEKRAGAHGRPEDVVFREMGRRLAPDDVLAAVSAGLGVTVESLSCRRRGSWARAVAGRCLIRHAALTQREAAASLGMGTGAAVSTQQRALAGHLPSDRRLRKQEEKIEAILTKQKQTQTKAAASAKYVHSGLTPVPTKSILPPALRQVVLACGVRRELPSKLPQRFRKLWPSHAIMMTNAVTLFKCISI